MRILPETITAVPLAASDEVLLLIGSLRLALTRGESAEVIACLQGVLGRPLPVQANDSAGTTSSPASEGAALLERLRRSAGA